MEQGTTISNNVFNGVVWEESAVEAVTIVAKALLNLTEIFRSQNIQVTMIDAGSEKSTEVIDLDKPAE